MVGLGKCPECKYDLGYDDVEDVHFRGTVVMHVAYRCRKCDTVIGFSSHNRIS